MSNIAHSRLSQLKSDVDVVSPDVIIPHHLALIIKLVHFLLQRSSIMQIERGWFFDDASCLVTESCSCGTLLDLVNAHRLKHKSVHHYIVLFLTIELLRIVEHLHRVDIIHGDVKPDNILVRERFEMRECEFKAESCCEVASA